MKTRFWPLLALLSLSFAAATAQDKKTVPAKLGEATVFFHGAELTHTASSALAKGENEIYIEGLSPNVDLNSMKIKATGSVVISAYEFSVDYLSASKAPSTAVKKIQDSIEHYTAALDQLKIDIKINSDMLEMLAAGTTKNVSGSEKGLGIDELIKTMDYYKVKSADMQSARTALAKKKINIESLLARQKAQLAQETGKANKTSGVLKLNLSAPMAVTSTFTITYYTAAAGWAPYYDINVASSDKPVTIAAKSKVSQTTGLDWEKVKLTLSTATPATGKVAPLFDAWFLQQVRPAYYADAKMVQNSYSYAKEEKMMDEVVVVGYGTQRKASLSGSVAGVASAEPLILIDGQIATQAQMNALDPSVIKSVETLSDPDQKAIYGSRGAAGVILVTLKNGMDDYVSASDNELNITYNIDMPYTIPGNGKVQNIDLQTKQAPAEYKYYCAPKLDAQTFLLAEIADWEKLGLLSGKANVTYDGNYVGETYIDASSTQEKLALTLGTDKRVAVKREKLQDFSSVKTLGSDLVQVFTYQITVKNNQNRPVKLVLKDQYPISTNKSFEVVLRKENTTPWTANKEDVGVITWEEELAAGQTKTYRISYSVKYPKDMTLNL